MTVAEIIRRPLSKGWLLAAILGPVVLGLLWSDSPVVSPKPAEPTREPLQVTAKRPETTSTVDQSTVRATTLKIGGRDALGNSPMTLQMGERFEVTGELTIDNPERWLWGKHQQFPPMRWKEPWYQKNKDKVYPVLEARWRRAGPDGDVIELHQRIDPESQWEERPTTPKGQYVFDRKIRPPLRPGSYEFSLVLVELPAHGDRMFERDKFVTHTIYTQWAEVTPP